jgi:hypothetical protein
MFGRRGVYRAGVDPDGDTVLLGSFVLTALDLLVDRAEQRVKPRDPERIIAEVE